MILPGNMTMKNMMIQAEKMKLEMDKLQEEAGNTLVESSSGGGMVKVTAKSKGEITSIVVEDEILKSGDREMIQDLIQAAINEVLDKGRENIKEEMSKAASSMGIQPGIL